jgi:hypothetical protein
MNRHARRAARCARQDAGYRIPRYQARALRRAQVPPAGRGISLMAWALYLFLALAAAALHDSGRTGAKALAPLLTRFCGIAGRIRAAIGTPVLPGWCYDRPTLARCLDHVTAAARTGPPSGRQRGPIRRRLISP